METYNWRKPQVSGLSPAEQLLLDELFDVWILKREKNVLKTKYYEGKNLLKDLGISIPPVLRSVRTNVDWPAKAVDALSVRSAFDGYIFDDSEETGLEQILLDNDFGNLYSMATTSELVHSCSFLTVSKGGDYDPPVVLSAYSAENASAVWDYRKKRIKAGMAIIDVDKAKDVVTAFNLYTDKETIEVSLSGKNWQTNRVPHKMNRPLMEPLRYRPSINRPFGKSRISPTVRNLTDSVVRALLRAEIASEFFTTPQRYLIGADDSVIESVMENRWKAYVGNIFAVGLGQEDERPQYGQLQQMSMQPHIEYIRSLGALFAGATGIPISSLGIIHDNPASAEAIYAAKEDLVIEAESLNTTNGTALRNIGLMSLAISNASTVQTLTDNQRTLRVKWRPTDKPSIVSAADAMVKTAAAAPWIAETEVFLEALGFDDSTCRRLMSDKKKLQAQSLFKTAMQPEKVDDVV